jgi:TetR/AcrR family transcriptional regulator
MARSRSEKFELNRDTILRSAAALFAAQGYPGTSMNDVARACRVSKPLLYHYVDDKYQLLLEITDGHVSRLEAIVAEVDALCLAPQERLRRLIVRFVDEYAQARDEHGVLTKERSIVDAFARAIHAARPDLDPTALPKPLAMLLFGMMNWMFTWLRPGGALTHHDMAPIVADLFLGGLGAVGSAGPSNKAHGPRAAQAVATSGVVTGPRPLKRHRLREYEAAHHRQAERLAQFGAGADAQRDRHRAHHRGQRRHHDGAKAQDARLADRLLRRHAAVALRVEREVDHHDGVLLHDADQQQDADRRDQRQVLTEPHQRGERTHRSRRQAGEDGERVDVALVQHAEQHVDDEQRGDDQDDLAAL